MLHIRLLGEFSLIDDNRPIGALTDRLQALLSYLILHQNTPQSRQRISCQLWPDCSDMQARTKLRKALSHLRHTLPNADRLIIADFKTLQWQPQIPLALDLAQFEAAITTAQTDDLQQMRSALQQAVAEYRGDLLPNCQDEWIIPERDRLQQMYAKALEQLIQLLEVQQDYREALNYAQRLLRLDTFNEVAYCTLMRLYGLSGDRANALQVYHRCMTMLREELGINPGTTTRQLYEQLLREDELSISTPSVTPFVRTSSHIALCLPELPLVGRDREWNIIQDWINPILQQDKQDYSLTANQTAAVLLLKGEPGIGKTRLLEELRQVLQAEQVQGLWGRGFAPEMVRPYGIWIDALRSIALPTNNLPSELGFLLPELGQVANTPPGDSPRLHERSHLFDAVVQVLAQWADQSPIVVMFDDIQWIDEASSALLHYAIRLLSHLPVRFACIGRSSELQENEAISKVLQALRREQRMQTLDLPPLDRAQTLELIRNSPMLKQVNLSIEMADRVFKDSGGNPLFALEVVRSLLQNHPTQTDTLEGLIQDRLQQLDETAREFLSWAAAFGRSFQPTVVGQIADYPLSKLLMALEQLEQQVIIRPSHAIGSELSSNGMDRERSYDFSHDIVRQVVYQQISEPRRCLVHLQIAHQLHQRFTQSSLHSHAAHSLASDIAHHASLGGDHELAASTALTAAEQCLKLFAYAEAAEMAQRGIQHCTYLDDRTRIRLHLSLLWVLNIAGVTGDRITQLEQDVQRLMQEAIPLGLKEEEAIGLEILMLLNVNQSNFANLHEHSLRATEISRVSSPATAAQLLAYSGSCWAEIGREMHRAEALLREAESLAARVGVQPIDLFCGLGCLDSYYAHYAEAKTQLQQALQLAQVEQDHWRECNILSYLAMAELESGQPVTALPYCNEMAIVAAKIQGEGSEGVVATALASLANYQLQPSEAAVDLEQAITLLYEVDAKRMLSYVLIGAAEVDLANQQLERASNRAESALQAAQIINQPCEMALAGAILMQTALALGEPDRAATQWKFLQNQIDRRDLSVRAKTAIDRSAEQLQSFFAVTF